MTGIRFSHMWALGGFSAPPEARGRSPVELWAPPRGHFGCNLDPLGKVWDHFWGNFLESCMPWECSERRNVLTFAVHIVGTPKADQRRFSAHGRSISLEKNHRDRVEDHSTDIPTTGTHFPRKTSRWRRLTRGRRQRPQAFSVRRPRRASAEWGE